MSQQAVSPAVVKEFGDLGYSVSLIRDCRNKPANQVSFATYVVRQCERCGTMRKFYPLAGTDRRGPCGVCGKETMWGVVEVEM